jgi:putative ABC transport system permease protein
MPYAVDAIRRRPGRSALTALGIGLATGLVVLLLALSAGVQASATTLAYSSGVDLLAASANSTIVSAELPPISDAHRLATAIPAADSNVGVASPWLLTDLVFGNQSLWSRANSSSVPANWTDSSSGVVGWIPSDNTGIETPVLYSGAGFTAPGDPHYANGSFTGTPTHQIVLDQALAEVLRVGVGDPVWTSQVAPPSNSSLPGWYANATEFTVVGISGPFWLVPSALLAYVYLSELQALTGGGTPSTDYASLMLIHLASDTDPAADQARIAQQFPNLSVYTLGDILGALQHVVNVYRTFGVLVGGVGVVIAVLFATTVLQMSVDDRSRELALLRAIGYRRARVGLFVVEEACLLSAFGFAAGLPLAYLAARALNAFLLGIVGNLPASFSFISFDPAVLLSGVAVVIAVGLAAALAPALRAMQLPVAEELRAP